MTWYNKAIGALIAGAWAGIAATIVFIAIGSDFFVIAMFVSISMVLIASLLHDIYNDEPR